jgi:hypothetical protein
MICVGPNALRFKPDFHRIWNAKNWLLKPSRSGIRRRRYIGSTSGGKIREFSEFLSLLNLRSRWADLSLVNLTRKADETGASCKANAGNPLQCELS